MKVKIIPISQRAKNRVREHGEIMILLKEESDKFLVESLEKTVVLKNRENDKFAENWLGWFQKQTEADFEEI